MTLPERRAAVARVPRLPVVVQVEWPASAEVLGIQGFSTGIENREVVGEVLQDGVPSCPNVWGYLAPEHELEG